MKIQIFLIIFIVITISKNKQKTENKVQQKKHKYIEPTHYVFELQVPQTICKFEKCQKEFLGDFTGETFTIHGLWPSIHKKLKKQPSFCKKKKGKQFVLSEELTKKCNKNYIGMYNNTEIFRQKEYFKHGTCTPQAQELEQGESINYFFNKINELFEKYPLHSILKDNKIVPSKKEYDLKDIEETLNKALGVEQYNVKVLCHMQDEKQYFYRVQLFFDLDYKLIHQPTLKQQLYQEELFEDQFITTPKLRGIDSQGQLKSKQCQNDKKITYPEYDFKNMKSEIQQEQKLLTIIKEWIYSQIINRYQQNDTQ